MTDWKKVLENNLSEYYTDEKLKKEYKRSTLEGDIIVIIAPVLTFASPWIVHFCGFFWQMLLTVIFLWIYTLLICAWQRMCEEEIEKRIEGGISR